ncbi:MAG: DNA recombination protein RmuC [Anaerovoracaceae bacterium]
MAALLNSLQMGFGTLAIQKHSSRVWNILGAVKTEFNKFGDVLSATQKKITQAGDELDKLIGTRTNKIMTQLKKVTELPEAFGADTGYGETDGGQYKTAENDE